MTTTTKKKPKTKKAKRSAPVPGSMTATTQCRKWKTGNRSGPRCKLKKHHRGGCDFSKKK